MTAPVWTTSIRPRTCAHAASLRRTLAPKRGLAAAEQELCAARAARQAGDSWTVLDAALDIAREAAQQRFGDG